MDTSKKLIEIQESINNNYNDAFDLYKQSKDSHLGAVCLKIAETLTEIDDALKMEKFFEILETNKDSFTAKQEIDLLNKKYWFLEFGTDYSKSLELYEKL